MAGTQSIERAVALLHLIAESDQNGATVVDLATKLKLDRTTTHRILQCLAHERLIAQVGEPRRYTLGPLIYRLGLIAAQRLDLRKLCEPSLARIAKDTTDTVFLMIREGLESVCADRLSGSFPIKTVVVDVGTRRPLGVGAGSLAILSALRPEEAEEAIKTNADRINAYEGVTAALVRKLAAQARISRRASLQVIDVEGAHAVAVPILNEMGDVIAALSVAAITTRMSEQRQAFIFDVLEREANAITSQLSKSALREA